MSLLPADAGRLLLGDTWRDASPLLTLVGAQYLFLAAAQGPYAALKAHGAAKATMAARLAVSVISVTASIVGLVVLGTRGAAAGLACGSAVSVYLYARALHRYTLVNGAARGPVPAVAVRL